MKNRKNAASIKRALLIALSVVLAIILVVLILATAYMESMLNKINKNPDDSTMSSQEHEDFLTGNTETMPPDFTGETPDPSDVDWDVNDGPAENAKHIINTVGKAWKKTLCGISVDLLSGKLMGKPKHTCPKTRVPSGTSIVFFFLIFSAKA